jgi:hypothetical protein
MRNITGEISEYAAGGVTFSPPVGGTKPELSAEERAEARRADRWPVSSLLKYFGWTSEQLNAAIAEHKFPKPSGEMFHRGLFSVQTREIFYSRAAVARWLAEIRRFTAALPK